MWMARVGILVDGKRNVRASYHESEEGAARGYDTLVRGAIMDGTRQNRGKYNFPKPGECTAIRIMPGIRAERLARARAASSSTTPQYVGVILGSLGFFSCSNCRQTQL